MKLGNISVTYVDLMLSAIRSLDGDPEPLLKQYSLDETVLTSPDARISIPRFMRLGHDAIRQLNTPILGLEMGRLMRAPHCGLSGLIAYCARDLKQACQVLTQYELLSSYNVRGESRFYTETDPSDPGRKQGVAEFYSISPYNLFNLFVVDYVLLGWCSLIRTFLGHGDLGLRAEFEFEPPEYADHYEDYFGCDVRFGCQRNAIVIDSVSLDRPLLNHCKATFSGLERKAQQELQRAQQGYSFEETVERAVAPLLNGQTPSIEQVAQRLHLTPWTLRRRLAAEKTSYQVVVNNTRRDFAISYVKDTQLTLGEIAYLVGFGSSTAFQRAFKRWTGQPPGHFRQQETSGSE